MAIVIPSKHIYNKDNDKIRDNVIDRIEVSAKEVAPNNEYDTPVYNEDLSLDNIEKIENSANAYKDAVATNQGGSSIRNVRGACGLKYILNYVTIPEIYIPKVQKNKFIPKIYDGKDDDGNPRIKINLRIKQTNYKGNSSYQPSSNTFDFEGSTLTKEETEKENIFYGFEEFQYKNDISSTVSSLSVSSVSSLSANHSIIEENNKLKISSYLYANSNNNWSPSIITVDNYINANLRENDIVVTSEIINGVEFYKLSSTKLLIGMDTTFMSCLIENTNSFSSISGYYRAVATRVLQECQQISLTVYGNTIGIDLTDKTVYIPDESGNKPFSIEGNELMQTSNYNTSKEFLLKKVDSNTLISTTSYYVWKYNIVNSYYTYVNIGGEKNSLETYVDYKDTKDNVIKTVIIPPRQTTYSPALVTQGEDTIEIIKVYNKNSICSQFQDTLLEYSNGKETATILCDIYNYDVGVKFKVLSYELLDDGSVYCRLKTDNINDIYDISNIGYIYVNGIEGFVRDIDEEEFILFVYFNDASVIDYLKENEITINNTQNFYFNIGDVVIPMVYGANGADKPMSKYKDGTHKKFKVLGTRIFYDGAVWQELTLQETLE